MLRLYNYLKFLLTSTNQHGVHSPFVYSYVTKCLYSKEKNKSSRSIDVLLKSISYFNPKNVWLSSEDGFIKRHINAKFPLLRTDEQPYDLIFMDISRFDKEFPMLISKIHNDTVLLIDAIQKNSKNFALWEKIKSREEVTITIDMFSLGAVFFRREQVKEHFKIRI